MKTSYDLTGMVDKHAVAEQLGLVGGCNEFFMVMCDYHPDCVLINDDRSDRDETLGHVFSAKMAFDDESNMGHEPEFSFTDLEGDLRLTLAAEIEKRANAMLEVATALRLHHEDEMRGAP